MGKTLWFSSTQWHIHDTVLYKYFCMVVEFWGLQDGATDEKNVKNSTVRILTDIRTVYHVK